MFYRSIGKYKYLFTGPEASIAELTDFITATQMAKGDDVFYKELPDESKKKRKLYELEVLKKKKREMGTYVAAEDDPIRLPIPMVGYGVPTAEGSIVIHRNLPEAAIGPPYFYYENVALAPKGV
ncbi:hypothetical protein POM88_030022 [Heracleum sosnowskyi]|uniref:Uncharacterized protein n=1 Tax=Heracleum sosnowskyi TaxID=360622 RepID=A0AAD8HW13_9APIA|nr:hypothetical protein POM88_030022 [Heracleum sosnowskyi]